MVRRKVVELIEIEPKDESSLYPATVHSLIIDQ